MTTAEVGKYVKKISENQAIAVDTFMIPDSTTIGVVVRGKKSDEDMPSGQELLGFMLQPQKFLLTSGDLIDKNGVNLRQKYAYKLNHQVIRSLYGRTLDDSAFGTDGSPVKTVFVFFDPYCEVCHKFYHSSLPDRFSSLGIRLVWVPVTILDDSLESGLFFLHTGKWAGRGQPMNPAASCCPPPDCNCDSMVVNNTKRMLRLNPGEAIGSPYFVWPTGDNGPGYDYFEGIPDVNRIQAIADRVVPISYTPYSPPAYPLIKVGDSDLMSVPPGLSSAPEKNDAPLPTIPLVPASSEQAESE